MRVSGSGVRVLGTIALVALCLCAGASSGSAVEVGLTKPDALELHSVKSERVTYRGRESVKIVDGAPDAGDDAGRFAIVKGTSVRDGEIGVSLSGDTAAGAPAQLRGFVGIAFRMSKHGSSYECLYLRPKNGRSEDQLQRNHSTQYISVPGYPWDKLRAESPGR